MPAPAQPSRPHSRRGGSRLYSPGSDATTRRLVTASERRARRERDQADGSDTKTPESSESSGHSRPSRAATAVRTAEPGAKGTPRERRPRPLLRPVALGIATLLLGGLAAWFGAEAHSLTSVPAAGNSALTDAAATSTVRSQVSRAVSALFSYDYANPGPTTQAARRLLTGPAVHQYASLFAQVRKDAPAQKLIVTTAVTSVGVELLTGNQARLLVFATESNQRAGGSQPASAAAMLAVNAVRQGSTWKIEGIDTY